MTIIEGYIVAYPFLYRWRFYCQNLLHLVDKITVYFIFSLDNAAEDLSPAEDSKNYAELQPVTDLDDTTDPLLPWTLGEESNPTECGEK